MFVCVLKCGECGFVTRQFMPYYYPVGRWWDFVLQDDPTSRIRIVRIENLGDSAKPVREPEVEVERIATERLGEIVTDTEREVFTCGNPETFEPLVCPDCSEMSVRFEILGFV